MNDAERHIPIQYALDKDFGSDPEPTQTAARLAAQWQRRNLERDHAGKLDQARLYDTLRKFALAFFTAAEAQAKYQYKPNLCACARDGLNPEAGCKTCEGHGYWYA